MRATKIAILLAIVTFLAACDDGYLTGGSVHPLFTKDDLVSDLASVGIPKGSKQESALQALGKNPFKITVEQDGSKREFQAHLLSLGRFVFLDVVPVEGRLRPGSYQLRVAQGGQETELKSEFALLPIGDLLYLRRVPEGSYEFVPTHLFLKARMDGEGLHLAPLDQTWLKEALDRGEIALAHERVADEIILTAPTEELHKFVLKYAEDPRAFSENIELHPGK